jgi:quinohemoprotein ethanol dehydrogenase
MTLSTRFAASWDKAPSLALASILAIATSGAGLSMAGSAWGAEQNPQAGSRGVPASQVDNAALSNESDTADWLAYGRTYRNDRYSPLTQVNDSNVARLGVAWFTDLPSNVGLVSTPLVANGVMYITDSRNIVRSVDAHNGRVLWTFDPQVAEHAGDRMDTAYLHGGRGLALWKGKVFQTTVDGRLIALDAKTGKEVWSTGILLASNKDPSWVDASPFVFNGKVLVSFCGGESGNPRGYVTAYDAQTGKMAWRFFIVPGDPAKGFEDKAQEMAAKTWTGDWWKSAGGGLIYGESFTYDAETNTLFVGTGNPTPHGVTIRAPQGGDELFTTSIVALNADTGQYLWHYQEIPGDQEHWDYDAVSPILLADLNIDGRNVKALMQAPKSGFFYVLDRTTGKLISAEPFGVVNWASKYDLATGRPVVKPGANFEINGPSQVRPGGWGAHTSWVPISYNPMTGLVYIPAHDDIDVYTKVVDGKYTEEEVWVDDGNLVAWDPVHQQRRWAAPQHHKWLPGTMTTAGNLVFLGDIGGNLSAYDASTGKVLWTSYLGLGITAPPISYSVDGHQYISIMVGYGGGYSTGGGGNGGEGPASLGWAYGRQTRRLVTFELDGKMQLPALLPPQPAKLLSAPDFKVDPTLAEEGSNIFRRCFLCHGAGAVSGGLARDLRASQVVLSKDAFTSVVRGGALRPMRMPSYPALTDRQLDALRNYIRAEAEKAL